jgi:hypothetical protein
MIIYYVGYDDGAGGVGMYFFNDEAMYDAEHAAYEKMQDSETWDGEGAMVCWGVLDTNNPGATHEHSWNKLSSG